MRLRRKVQFEETKQANQRRVLSDSESVRWLNHAIEKLWPLCMEQIVSQKLLLPVVPWFLDKYKPWTAKKAVIESLYMGRNPPICTYIRVLSQSSEDDHLVLELGINFLADGMSAPFSVKLRKILGFGMWTKLYMTGMHLEGKVTVGIKFLNNWPFIGRLRVCFVEHPFIQMNVKPPVIHGLDVAVLPGIAGWLDKLLSIAFEQTFVEPNMVVVDVEKFASPQPESQFFVDEKEPFAYVKVEVIEAADLKPSDLNGLADPYVKGRLGSYVFRTRILKKTLAPKWQEEFKVPICTWDSPNLLQFEVCDKDHFVDDTLGDCTVNILDVRDGKRHDMWIPLKSIKMGRLHLGVTVIECVKECDDPKEVNVQEINVCDSKNSLPYRTSEEDYLPSVSRKNSNKVSDAFEPINIEGQQEAGIWVHRPGSEGPRTWEPRKGKSRCSGDGFAREINGSISSSHSMAPGPSNIESTSAADKKQGSKSTNTFHSALRKIGLFFVCGSTKKDASQHQNLRLDGDERRSVNYVNIGKPALDDEAEETLTSADREPKRHGKGHLTT
ncbi:unnamed protein product [Rhodiola kirilowii]